MSNQQYVFWGDQVKWYQINFEKVFLSMGVLSVEYPEVCDLP